VSAVQRSVVSHSNSSGFSTGRAGVSEAIQNLLDGRVALLFVFARKFAVLSQRQRIVDRVMTVLKPHVAVLRAWRDGMGLKQ
jgi:hypothetical protein